MDDADLGYLHALRRYEVERVLAALGPGRGRLLEIGAGTGHQASLLQEAGFDVIAVDLARSSYAADRVFDVRDYDGEHLPCEDGSVAVVYSSNVLEHVPHLDAFEREIHRVLAPGGVALHVLPSPTWRIAAILGELPARLRKLVAPRPAPKPDAAAAEADRPKPRLPWWRKLGRILGLRRHGERGSALTEIWWFSRPAWRRHFRKTGWEIAEIRPGGLFYTGQSLLGLRLPLARRERLARWLGSATTLYLLRPARAASAPGRAEVSSPSPR